MSTPPAPAKLWVLFASQAPIGVILRRGPSRWCQLVLWETDTDTFTPGQWVKGRITGPSLSPDGQYMAMEMMGGRSRTNSWEDTQYTFVTRPPYFTALGVVVRPLCWGNTISFDSEGRLNWDSPDKIKWNAPNPCPLEITTDYYVDPNLIDTSFEFQTEWTSPQGRKFLAKDGILYEDLDGESKLLIDLNSYQPTQVETPDWARRW